MRRTKLNLDKSHWANLSEVCRWSLSLLTLCVPTRSMAQQPGQKTLSSAEEASQRTGHGSAG